MRYRYNEADWIEYRHHEGWISDGKILEVRPDDRYLVGSHDKDPNPDLVDADDVTGRVSK